MRMRRILANLGRLISHHRLVFGLGVAALVLTVWGQLDGFKTSGWPGFNDFGESLVASLVGLAVGAVLVILVLERQQRERARQEDDEVRKRAGVVRELAAQFVYSVTTTPFQVPDRSTGGVVGGLRVVQENYEEIATVLGVSDNSALRAHGPTGGRDNPAFQAPMIRGVYLGEYIRMRGLMHGMVELLDRTMAWFHQGLIHHDLLDSFERLSGQFAREQSQWEAYDERVQRERERQ